MSELSSTLQNNLCKGLRACGIGRAQAHQIMNEVQTWYRENGMEWTNARIKDLRQWYETYLTGSPKPPAWFKHSKEGLPLGIWKWVFSLKPAKALGVLSCNTIFYEDRLSKKQLEKFEHALAGNKSQDPDKLREFKSGVRLHFRLPKKMPEILFPTVFDMTGSMPCQDGRNTVRGDQTVKTALKALRKSWESLPQVTFDFLVKQDLLAYMPLSVVGSPYRLELERTHDRCVGRVSVLQQAQLKARIVGNPNRVTQVTLEPLKKLFMDFLRKLLTDVTHDQESGVAWVQDQLRQGNELAGSDLTSASDLLDVRLCLELVESVFGFPEVAGYSEYRDYFLEVSRSAWWCPALNREVKWEQGDVLGTGPSFGLLSLTNNAAAYVAYFLAYEDGVIPEGLKDCEAFRVVGDDIVMRSELEPYYTKVIESLGGEINHSKTLKSNRVAEFAGRVITSDCSYLKAIKYSEPSDSSFLSYVAQLGDQAKYLLKPKQRKVYDLLKEVPGVLVDGPWMRDSYGVPLGPRYSWYLTEVEPRLAQVEPDLKTEDYSMTLLKAQLSLEEGQNDDVVSQLENWVEPLIDDGYLPSQVTPTFKVGGDPRLTQGKTTLDVLYQHIETKDITPFSVWIQDHLQTTSGAVELTEEFEEIHQSVSESSAETVQGLLDSFEVQANHNSSRLEDSLLLKEKEDMDLNIDDIELDLD